MSRSSKGFADFFPTAPSVLQQKRSKSAQFRRRGKSPALDSHKSAEASSVPLGEPHRHAEGSNPANGAHHDEFRGGLASAIQDEVECVPGDLLNGVGSASSTSTASSIFSTSNHAPNMAHANGNHKSTSLTPLTNADSSPKSNAFDFPQNQRIREKAIADSKLAQSPSNHEVTKTSTSLKQQHVKPLSRTQARPDRGEVKGLKAIYDPDLDKKLTSKERKSRQVQYEEFGKEVRASFGVLVDRFHIQSF